MPQPRAGEVWIVDLGLAAKVRPCLLLTDYPSDDDLALITIVAHTNTLRGAQWEHSCPKPFLREGVYHLQQIQSVPVVKLMRKLGELAPTELLAIRQKLKSRLQL
jgi:mRNA interferase MazF